jgi:hypothetical protein
MLMVVVVDFLLMYPPHEFVYSAGGAAAAFTGTIASLLAAVLIGLDACVFHVVSPQQTLEQKKFELANFLFVLYIIFGSILFSHLEPWTFERAGAFCLMTLLTIGYGDIVPITFWGRMSMILYTIFGLALAGFFIVSFEDVITGQTLFDELVAAFDLGNVG